MTKDLMIAKKNITNSLVKDGYEILLSNGKIVRVKLSEGLAKRNIKNGMFSDWVNDEMDFIESIRNSLKQ